jgi:hypothetical protein
MGLGDQAPRGDTSGQLAGVSIERFLNLLHFSDGLESYSGGEFYSCWVQIEENFLKEKTSEIDFENINHRIEEICGEFWTISSSLESWENELFLALELQNSNGSVGNSFHSALQNFTASGLVVLFLGISELIHISGAGSQKPNGVQISTEHDFHSSCNFIV